MRHRKPDEQGRRGQKNSGVGALIARRAVEEALEVEYAAAQAHVEAGRAARGTREAEDWTARLALAYRQGELAGIERLAERLFGVEYAEGVLPERARTRLRVS